MSFKIFGIKVVLTSFWWIWIGTWCVMAGIQMGNWIVAPAVAFLFFSGIYSIVLLHELGHSLAANKLGYQVKEILIHPFGGLAIIGGQEDKKDWRRNHLHEFWITLCGPLVNVFILMLIVPFMLTGYDNIFLSLMYQLNWIFLGINLLPIYPLDGGRLMRCTFTWWLKEDWKRATVWARWVTLIALFTAVPVLIWMGYWLAAIVIPLIAFLGLQEPMEFERPRSITTVRVFLNGKEIDPRQAIVEMRNELESLDLDNPSDQAYCLWLSQNILATEKALQNV